MDAKKIRPLPNPYHVQIGRTIYLASTVNVWVERPVDGKGPRWMPRLRITPVEAV
jgi:hypothetical protein